MPFSALTRVRKGSVTRWFAYAAAAIVITAAVGAHGLAWIAQSKRTPAVAVLPLDPGTLQARSADGIDMDATGTIPRGMKAP